MKLNISSRSTPIGVEWWASLALAVLHGVFFAFKIRKEWVRLAAEAYARQLLASCDILGSEQDD